MAPKSRDNPLRWEIQNLLHSMSSSVPLRYSRNFVARNSITTGTPLTPLGTLVHLPLELRRIIYNLVTQTLTFIIDEQKDLAQRTNKYYKAPRLLFASKHINAEFAEYYREHPWPTVLITARSKALSTWTISMFQTSSGHSVFAIDH